MQTIFSLLIVEHKFWGAMFQPYMLSKVANYYSIEELLSSKNIDKFSLTETERDIVSLCDNYNDNNIVKTFSKEKVTLAEFMRKNKNNSNIIEFILKHIDKNVYKVAELLKETDIPVYHKKAFTNLYDSDRINVDKEFSKCTVLFERTSEDLRYSRKVINGGTQINLKGGSPLVLSNSPCCILLKNNLLTFKDIDYNKISPFFSKEFISIAKKTERKYMETFVMNAIKEDDVEAKGFCIRHNTMDFEPVVTVSHDFNQNAVLNLDFKYGDKLYHSFVQSPKQVALEVTGDQYVFTITERDLEREKFYVHTLNEAGFQCVNTGLRPYNSENCNIYDIIDLLTANKSILSDFTLNINFDDKNFVIADSEIQTNFSKQNDWFDINATVFIKNFSIPFYKLRNNILNGNREYVLPDGSVAVLPQEWFTRYSDLFSFGEETDSGSIRLKKMHVGIYNALESIDLPDKPLIKDEIIQDVPEGVNATLRNYQQEGYSWLCYLYNNNLGGCLADDMGLGKTLQFLSFFQYLYKGLKKKEVSLSANNSWCHNSAEPTLFDLAEYSPKKTDNTDVSCKSAESKHASLVIMPTSLLHNWKNEIKKFTPELSVLDYSGQKRVRTKNIDKIFQHYNIVLTTYGVIRNDIDFLSTYNFECIVLDESQYIKNTSSQIYQSILKLEANRRFVITGTPIENSLTDLWAQLNFVNKGMLGSLSFFKSHYVTPIQKYKNTSQPSVADLERKLQHLIKPFVLRRTKSEVSKDLPPVIEQTVLCEMNESQNKLYQTEKSAIRNSLMDQILQKRDSILAISALLRLRQIANHPQLVDESCELDSPKLESVLSHIESLQAGGHKVLIFSSFVKLLNIVEERLNSLGFSYEKLTGETSNREKVIESFQNNPEKVCFLISLKAGGVGLNLTAADYVFILDPWWNPAAELQAINRSHRIGQKRTVMVYKFITKDTVEEKIQQLQCEKNKLANTFINTNNPFAAMEFEEIRDLFA